MIDILVELYSAGYEDGCDGAAPDHKDIDKAKKALLELVNNELVLPVRARAETWADAGGTEALYWVLAQTGRLFGWECL